MNINKRFLLIFFLAIFTYAFYINTTLVKAAASNCPCVAYELYSCPNNPGCKVVYDKNGKPLNKCGYGTCMRCKTYKCDNPCVPLKMKCSASCGIIGSCADDGCGGKVCCPSTEACRPTIKPATPTPITYCSDTKSCPIGQECYQPPMPPCTSGGCIQSMPAKYCRPVECPKRPQGDANCDQLINDADFIVIKSAMKGLKYAALNYSADFNNNNKVDLVDYEIWRNTLKH
jgi:hypothetical protein